MPWVRFDDQFPINRKVTRLSDAAFRLHVSAVFWCARNLTDGAVPEEDLEDVSARVRTPGRFVPELLDRGLWHEVGTECSSPNCPADPHNAVTAPVTADKGWVIHDYFEYQPSKEQVLADRAGSAERQKRWRERQKQAEQARNAVSNGASNGGSNAAPSRPVPYTSPNGDVSPPNPPRKRGTTEGEETGPTDPSRTHAPHDEQPRPPSPDAGTSAAPPETKTAQNSRDRGTRLPDHFPVTPALAAWARDKAPLCGDDDHAAFCDYWRSQPGVKGRKTDWAATWRNWMRRAQADRQRRQSSLGRAAAAPPKSTTDQRVADALALAERLAAGQGQPTPAAAFEAPPMTQEPPSTVLRLPLASP